MICQMFYASQERGCPLSAPTVSLQVVSHHVATAPWGLISGLWSLNFSTSTCLLFFLGKGYEMKWFLPQGRLFPFLYDNNRKPTCFFKKIQTVREVIKILPSSHFLFTSVDVSDRYIRDRILGALSFKLRICIVFSAQFLALRQTRPRDTLLQ